ncbi:DUF7535 family protein [Natrialbaceae archaeon A-gly3]
MSRADVDDDDASTPEAVLRTVTPPYRGQPNRSMSTIGWIILIGLLIVLLPLLPAAIALWLVVKLLDRLARWRK